MGLSRRKFTKEFKIAALRQIDGGGSIAAVARSCEIDPSLLHRWRRGFQQGPEHAFPGLGKKRADENRVAELERKIGQQALEIDFLKANYINACDSGWLSGRGGQVGSIRDRVCRSKTSAT